MEIKNAFIVLADISGYTKFVTLHAMSLLHAEKIVTELLESIMDATSEPLIVNKLEGDAVLFYAEAGESETDTARAVFAQSLAFFEAFSERSKELTGCNNLCPCDACRQADQLRLKTVLHFGEIALKRVRNFVELAGESVIVAHRLTKNSIDSNEYLLMTKSFAEVAGQGEACETESRTEECAGIGRVEVEVHYPNSDLESPDAPEKEPRKKTTSLANAFRLDLYSLARVLRLKRPPRGRAYPPAERPGFWQFARDGFRGLWMLFRRK
ncbi:MAG: hypothetical protein ACI8UO_003539 [Verrucomicrobiales bacterium]|jgi:hypothetical protein